MDSELPIPTRPLLSLLGIVQLSLLNDFYMKQEIQNGPLTLLTARATIDEFKQYIAFDLAVVDEFIASLTDNRVIRFEELELWVKLAFISYLKDLGFSHSNIEVAAQKLISSGMRLSSSQVAASLFGGSSHNLIEKLYHEGIVTPALFRRSPHNINVLKQSEFLQQSRPTLQQSVSTRVIQQEKPVRKILNSPVHLKPVVSPRSNDLVEYIQKWLRNVFEGDGLLRTSELQKHLQILIQQQADRKDIHHILIGHQERIRSQADPPLMLLHDLIKDLSSGLKQEAPQFDSILARLYPIVQGFSNGRRDLIQKCSVAIDGLEASLKNSNIARDIATQCEQICREFRALFGQRQTKFEGGDFLSELDKAKVALEELLAFFTKSGEDSQQIQGLFGRLGRINLQNDVDAFGLDLAKHIKMYESFLEPAKQNVLIPLKQILTKYDIGSRSVMPPKQAPKTFGEALRFSMNAFSNVRKSISHRGEKATDCDAIIAIFKDASEKPVKNLEKTRRSRQGLLDIFTFYSRQRNKDPSQTGGLLTREKFIVFCRDFAVVGSQQNQVSEQQALKLYQGNCAEGHMNEQQFLSAVDQLAQVFNGDGQNRLQDSANTAKDRNEKIRRFYEFLECDQAQKYGKRMKGYFGGRKSPDVLVSRRLLRSNSPVFVHSSRKIVVSPRNKPKVLHQEGWKI